MITNRSLIAAVIASTILCAALVWSNAATASRARELKAQLETKEAELQKLAASEHGTSASPDTGLAEMIAQRDAEYAQLREDYDKLKQELTNAVPVDANTTNAPGSRFGRGNGGPNAWLERLRLQDPERYNQMVAAREQRRQRVEQQYQDQMTQLDNRIQTAPTQEEVDLATQIADTLDRLGQLRQQMQPYAGTRPDQLPAEAQELFAQMRDASRTLRDLGAQDRARQLQDLGSKLGLPDQAAQKLPDTIAEIYQNTDYHVQGGSGGRGGFGGFGGGRGGSGGNAGGTSSAAQPQPSSSSPAQ